MLTLLLLYFVTVLFESKGTLKGTADYLSIENTAAIKGIFIFMVFYSHFNSYLSLPDTPSNQIYFKFFYFIGQAMVALFLFYSGYGVMESIKRRGKDYILKIPKNRILKTLINFDIAVVLYLVLGLVLGNRFTVKQILLSFIGWDSLGNSNWYIFVILLLYLLTFVVFAIVPKKPYMLSVAILGVFVCAIILVTHRYNIRPSYWYDTALCYVLGMGYSLVKQQAEKIINKNIFVWVVCLVASAVAYINIKGHIFASELVANLLFTVCVVIFTMRITLNNPVLKWGGAHLFEIYILQRIPMIIFKALGLAEYNVYLYFAACVLVTVALTFAFKAFTNRFWKTVKL